MYDAWGKLLEIDGSLASTIGEYNPYRYRGYRYDEEIDMYYLNSRFYDANIGRFISSDGMIGPRGYTLGHNMFSYTQNNPIMFSDPSGEFFITAMIILQVAIIIVVIIGTSSNTEGECYASTQVFDDGFEEDPNIGVTCEMSSSIAEYRTDGEHGPLSGSFEADFAEAEGGWDLGFITINANVSGYAGGVGAEGNIEFKPTDGKVSLNGGLIALLGFSFELGIEWGD